MINIHRLWHNRERSWIELDLIPGIPEGFIQLRSICSLVSHGTEGTMIREQLSSKAAENMHIPYMKGDFIREFTYGYSLVAEAEDGRYFHLLHPHQDVAVVDQKDVFPIPDNLPPSLASLISNMETAITICWDADPEQNERVLILGLGMIGTLTSMVLTNIYQLDHDLFEKRKDRRSVSELLKGNLVEEIEEDYDVVINCSGSAEGLTSGLKALRMEGRLIEASWYGSKPVSVPLGEDFHYKRLRIISSQVSSIPGHMVEKWDHRSRKKLACKLLMELDPNWIISEEVDFMNSPAFFDKLRKGNVNHLATLIKY